MLICDSSCLGGWIISASIPDALRARFQKLVEKELGSWGTQTFIAGLSPEALIAAWVIKGALDSAAFTAYVEQVLIPELERAPS